MQSSILAAKEDTNINKMVSQKVYNLVRETGLKLFNYSTLEKTANTI